MKYRIEHDTLGEVKVPANHMWGAQTERSVENFKIGSQMPHEIIKAFAILKKCTAKINAQKELLDNDKWTAICEACDEIIEGKWNDEFPLVVYQTGSGTQSNMNMNEVIAHIANEKLKCKNIEKKVHPNDDVNMSQSSNDTFPTAMHIAAVSTLRECLYKSLKSLSDTFHKKSDDFKDVVKIGRTHLQDAVPMTLGQEFSGWAEMLDKSMSMIKNSEKYLLELAIGGTAVGTGINSPEDFGEKVSEEIAKETGIPFVSAANKFYALTGRDDFVFSHGALEALAMDCMKFANDIRWLASGPRAGFGEIIIPANEPGSSIMPGKVNPTQCEALTMVACRVHGNQATISFASSQGNFELNVFAPVMANSYIESVKLLSQSIHSFNIHCAIGIEPNYERMNQLVNSSLMLVTALSPHIGYEKSAKIAKQAHKQKISLKEAAIASGYVSEEDYDKYVNPAIMTNKDR